MAEGDPIAGAMPACSNPVGGGRRPATLLRAIAVLCLVLALAGGGYAAWMVWGTGIATSRAQRALRTTFEQDQPTFEQDQPTFEQDRPTFEHELVTPLRAPPLPKTVPVVHLAEGAPVMLIRIARIHLDMVVVEGTSSADLAMGPGHYLGTSLPWEPHGRVAIAGHRTTHLHPFWSLDRLLPGDLIELETRFGTYRYRVTGIRTVLPSAGWVLAQTLAPSLVLTTCTPRFSASHRLIVFAEMA